MSSPPKHAQDDEDNEADDRPEKEASQDAPQVGPGGGPNDGVFRCESFFHGIQFAVNVSHDA